MLTIYDKKPTKTCSGLSRRELLRVGAMGSGLFSLSNLLATKSHASDFLRNKSVVLLFLQGGPSHIEFFDPKMTAPAEIRSVTGEIQTATPGITFGSTFPKLASMMDKFTVVRSYQSRNSGHTYLDVTSARNPFKASISSIYSRIAGTNHPQTGMPRNVLLLPEAIDGELKLRRNFETSALPTLVAPGVYGTAASAFNPSGGGDLKANMEMKIEPERLLDRQSLLRNLDNIRRDVDATGFLEGADRYQTQAFDVIARGVADAFNLEQEDPKVVAEYDSTGVYDQRSLQRYHDMSRASNLLGHQMLLARRLVERGCGFVTVSDCGWDMHANNNSPKNMTGIWPMARQVDHAVAAFIHDIHRRGLQDDVLLVVTGEMGRTPRINGNGGRDHYGNVTSLLMSGGGINPGQVIGRTDSQASKPITTPYGPEHLLGTILRTVFDVGELRLESQFPSDLLRWIEGTPIIDGVI
ncbi:MAG: DUF1501 domain-containing protein [Pirellulales bacterium]|nr:DUF1501 domain-containing protein [Pirellulales bacterium]